MGKGSRLLATVDEGQEEVQLWEGQQLRDGLLLLRKASPAVRGVGDEAVGPRVGVLGGGDLRGGWGECWRAAHVGLWVCVLCSIC